MRTFLLFASAAGVALLAAGGCSKSPSAPSADLSTPEAFLKWSMDRYKAMPTFQATDAVTFASDGKPSSPQTRRIQYASPNKFKLEITMQAGAARLTAVSDGAKLVDYSNQPGAEAMTASAPASLASSEDPLMQQPILGGSLVYPFFGGSAGFDSLVQTAKGPVKFGPEGKAPSGEATKEVDFYAQGQFGNAKLVIGEKTGYVYQAQYDLDPLIQSFAQSPMRASLYKQAQEALAKTKPGPQHDAMAKQIQQYFGRHTALGKESFSDIAVGAPIPASQFDTTLPKGVVAANAQAQTQPNDQPPVPLGQPAPDFQVTGLDGKTVKLSSLRGHVVLLDFWATWCPPCRKGLPETNRLAQVGGPKGLQVMAISNETHDKVAAFMNQNHYTMPAFLDAGSKAQATYRVDSIPTTVVIDAKGALVAYLVGLQDPSTIQQALAKAGFAG